MLDKLLSKHGEQLDEKSLTICSGVDYTNINYQHVVCPDPATAKVTIIKTYDRNIVLKFLLLNMLIKQSMYKNIIDWLTLM